VVFIEEYYFHKAWCTMREKRRRKGERTSDLFLLCVLTYVIDLFVVRCIIIYTMKPVIPK
jgi:hypothetical protein